MFRASSLNFGKTTATFRVSSEGPELKSSDANHLNHLNPPAQVLPGIQVTMDNLVIDQMPAPVEGPFLAHLAGGQDFDFFPQIIQRHPEIEASSRWFAKLFKEGSLLHVARTCFITCNLIRHYQSRLHFPEIQLFE